MDTGESDGRKTAPSYETFLYAEYEQIASAYFKAVESLSSFFKHYLVIAAIPLSAFALKYSEKLQQSGVAELQVGIPFVFLLVSLVGTFVLCYMSNLWFDQVLYARTVNGLRGYFTRRSGLSFSELSIIRVLPATTSQPSYKGEGYFYWVVSAVAIVNACYLGLSIFLFSKWRDSYVDTPVASIINLLSTNGPKWASAGVVGIIGGLALLWLSLELHERRARYRETSYLKSPTIGIDLDGVLNRHREHFAKVLLDRTGKRINPDDITRIPVHDCEGLGVTQVDEAQVFNDPDYWIEMPVEASAQNGLRELKGFFGSAQLRIYTRRDWPNYGLLPSDALKTYRRLWRRWCFLKVSVRTLTLRWLKRYGFPFHDVVIEGEAGLRPRFRDADAGLIRVFIEDDLANARRLAVSCEKVILLDAPYNRGVEELPPNVIRVHSWEQVVGELLVNRDVGSRGASTVRPAVESNLTGVTLATAKVPGSGGGLEKPEKP